MPVDGPVPWECTEHTAAKHDIYRRYLERWFPILLRGRHAFASVTYAEGFAGPGTYIGGEPGSPIIAIQALISQVPKDSGIARFVFVDDDPRCTARLLDELKAAFPDRPRTTTAMPVLVRQGTCQDELETALAVAHAWDQPIFANLDSWGNVPVPHRLLQRIAKNISSEVIVTLLPQHFVRFVTQLGPAGDEVFGGDPAWREVVNRSPEAKSRHILECYRRSLQAAGFKYLLDFELVTPRGQSLYLVFGTSNSLGVEKMKDSLWEVDRSTGIGFRDPRAEQAETLFELDEPDLAPLRRFLRQRLADDGPARVESLREWTHWNTVYRKQHVIAALTRLRNDGAITADHPGPIRRASTVCLNA